MMDDAIDDAFEADDEEAQVDEVIGQVENLPSLRACSPYCCGRSCRRSESILAIRCIMRLQVSRLSLKMQL